MKFTSFAVIVALAIALASVDLMRRRVPIIPIEMFTFSIAFWLMARQSITVMPQFLAGAISVARSHPEEMFAGGYKGVIWALAVAPPAVALFGYSLFKNKDWRRLPLFGFVLFFVALQLKEALNRYDPGHVWGGVISSLLPSCVLASCLCIETDNKLVSLWTQSQIIRVSVCWIALLSVALPVFEIRHVEIRDGIQEIAQNITRVLTFPTEKQIGFHYREKLAELIQNDPVEALGGTVDFFPDNEQLLYANGMEVHLPPVPQAYLAFNRDLTSRNAAFFRSKNRPDHVLFDVAPIDNLYPTMEDPLTWLALLDCYEPSGRSGRYVLLNAAPSCTGGPPYLISEVTSLSGREITVPLGPGNGSPVWAEVETRPKIAEEILSLLIKPPWTDLAVKTTSGTREFKFTPGRGKIGFLLSPMILDSGSFARLMGGEVDPNSRVRSIQVIHPKLGSVLFDNMLKVRFYSLPLGLTQNKTKQPE